MASTNEAAFVIGGYRTVFLPLDVVAQFKDDSWSLYGNLQKRRYAHKSITYGEQTMVIGGYDIGS